MQSPTAASVQPGHAVTLQCSFLSEKKENRVQCPGEHSVYWFRAGSGGSHPSIIYPHSKSNCDREDRSCVYSLSKTIQSSADNGTYYCAVVTCGEILFGEGTKVEISTFKILFSCFKLSKLCCFESTHVVILIPHKISLMERKRTYGLNALDCLFGKQI